MKLASIFTDHMVIQSGLPIKIFGEGKFRRDFAEDHPDRITFRFGEYYL